MAKLYAYYITNVHHELNYVGQNISENDFLKLMQDYSYSLSSDTALFEEDIQLNEDDSDDEIDDDLDLTNIDTKILNIKESIHLEYASNNTNQLVISKE